MAEMRITDAKGVHFTFDNGITISIQIGGGNYSDNYGEPISSRREIGYSLPSSKTAEIAAWDFQDNWIQVGDNDDIRGYVPVSDVLSFVAFLNSLPSELVKTEIELALLAFDWNQRKAA